MRFHSISERTYNLPKPEIHKTHMQCTTVTYSKQIILDTEDIFHDTKKFNMFLTSILIRKCFLSKKKVNRHSVLKTPTSVSVSALETHFTGSICATSCFIHHNI